MFVPCVQSVTQYGARQPGGALLQTRRGGIDVRTVRIILYAGMCASLALGLYEVLQLILHEQHLLINPVTPEGMSRIRLEIAYSSVPVIIGPIAVAALLWVLFR